MAQFAVVSAVLFALLAAAAAQKCAEVPTVSGVDQSNTSPAEYGKCSQIQKDFFGSHWCKFGKIGTWPGAPQGKAQQCLKFGRASIYRGPIYGSSSAHKAACNRVLMGDDKHAMVAVSTKYLKTYQGGWTSDTGACNKCMCIRMHGADNAFNSGLQTDKVSKRVGLTFMGKVRTKEAGVLGCINICTLRVAAENIATTRLPTGATGVALSLALHASRKPSLLPGIGAGSCMCCWQLRTPGMSWHVTAAAALWHGQQAATAQPRAFCTLG
jgi:hypothetical protein